MNGQRKGEAHRNPESVAWSNNVFHRRFHKEFENNMQVSTETVILTSQIRIGVICDVFDFNRRL